MTTSTDASTRTQVGTRNVVGQSVLRVEDRQLLTGTAEFLDDLRLPGRPLHVAYVRSTIAHGTITAIRTDAAAALHGVVAVFTHEDLAGVPDMVTPVIGASLPPRPLLPRERVRFVGEAIAAIVAESRYIAEDAIGLVEVDIEPMPSIATAVDALDPARPLVHDTPDITTNVLYERRIDVGDTDRAFAEAAHVVEARFRHPRVSAAPMEGRGAAAYVDDDGDLRFFLSTQSPHSVRDLVMELFGLRTRVQCPDIGGGFGLKAAVLPEELLVPWMAERLGRPVKWVEDRAEALLASGHSRDFVVDARAAVDADGRLLAIEVDALGSCGPYSAYPMTHVLETAGVLSMTPGPYRLENYRARGRAMATTTCPAVPYRGVGLPISTLVHERLMDLLAFETGLSPVEIRRRNLVTEDMLPYETVSGQTYDFGDYLATFDAAVEMIDYNSFAREQAEARGEGRVIGIGLATYVEWTSNTEKLYKQRGMTAIKAWDSCQVRLTEQGVLRAWTSAPAIGQGTRTAYAQILADASGFAFDDIEVLQSDTSSGDVDGMGTGSSRSVGATAGAIMAAGEELRSRLLADAADALGASVDDIDLRAGLATVRDETARFVTLPDLVAAAPAGRYDLGRIYKVPQVMFSYATHACKVEVDAETGLVTVLDYAIAEDCGRLINPLIVEGQTKGALAQGIAAALYESFEYDGDGQPLAASFMDYLMPTASETFRSRIKHLSKPVPHSVTGGKGVGEGGTIAGAACVANAVSNAVSQACNELPLHPESLQSKAQELLRRLPTDRA